MSLKYSVSKDDFGGLDESVQGLYTESGDNYVLAVDGLPEQEDVSGLKRKVDELLGEKKSAQQQAKEKEEQARQAAVERAQAEQNYKALYESAEEERGKAEKMFADLQGQVESSNINRSATELAAQLTTDAGRQKLLTEQFSKRLMMVDGELTVTDPMGNPTVSSTKELLSWAKKEMPFLVDGTKASGAGVTGGSSGAGESKELSRADFEALPSSEKKLAFIKSGGKII